MAQDLDVKIGAQFVGGKAFNQAKKEIGGLEGAAAALGKRLAGALSVYAIVDFAKKSIEAFAKDQAAAKALELQLQNTGNAFATADVEYFIQKTQKLTGVLDDNLRPAFQTLLTSSQSVIDSQKALAVALDISAATGKPLEEVSAALAKGYTGQTTAIQRLGVGIDDTTLKSGNMNKILGELQSKFSGQAQTRVKTFAGQIDQLKVAANDASEIIGKSLVDSITKLAGSDGDVTKVADAITSIATATGDAIYGLTSLIKKISELPGAQGFLGKLFDLKSTPVGILASYGKAQRQQDMAKGKSNFQYSLGAGAAGEIAAKKQVQIEKDRTKAIQTQNKLLADQTKTKKASALFDIDQIQIMAALQGQLSDNEKLRLQLQMALLQGNAAEADRLSNELAKSQLLTTGLAAAIANLPPALNPFKEFPNYINDILRQLMQLQDAMNKLKMPDLSQQTAISGLSPFAAAFGFPSTQAAADFRAMERSPYSPNVNVGFNNQGMPITVQVQLDGRTIAESTTDYQLNNSMSGSFSTIGSNGRVRDY